MNTRIATTIVIAAFALVVTTGVTAEVAGAETTGEKGFYVIHVAKSLPVASTAIDPDVLDQRGEARTVGIPTPLDGFGSVITVECVSAPEGVCVGFMVERS